jgi:basic membrane protein A and related proteins
MLRTTLGACLGALLLLASPTHAEDKLKVGFVYVGPVADYGYSFQHDLSRRALAEALPDKVETTYLENVPESDSERAIEKLARSGMGLIFTTSFGFMEPTLKVARKFPKVKFEHATGYKRAANVSTYSARFYEGRYVCGKIAATLTKTGTIGYIASFPIPEVVSGINAFMLGAQSVNPNVKLKIVWVNTRARKPKPPRPCSPRGPTSWPSTRTPPRPSRRPRSRASSPSASPRTSTASPRRRS